MKHKPNHYAEALLKALGKKSDAESLMKNFLRVLEKNGDKALLPKIFKILKSRLLKKEGGHFVEVEAARPLSRQILSDLSSLFRKKDLVEISLNPALIAGVRITIDGNEELDNSFKHRLKKLFF